MFLSNRGLVGFAALYPSYEGKKEGSGTPTNALFRVPHAAARGSRHGKVGLRRPSACGRARLSAFHHGFRQRDSRPQGSAPGQASWDRAPNAADIAANADPSSSKAPRVPVVVPAGMMPGPPESEADEAPPAGTALAPFRLASPGRRP